MKQTRNSNIELLRILSMVMVLVLHALNWSGALEYLSGVSYWVYWWMEALCIIAVDVFVLISGYFLVESKFKSKNVFKVAVGGVWLYSVIFSTINLMVSGNAVTLNYLMKMVLPFTTKKFWFVNSYIALYLFSPFLNKLIHALNQKQFTALVCTLVAMFSLRVTFLPMTWSQDATGGMNIQSFITLYCIAAWLRLYYKHKGTVKKYLMIYFTISVLLPISKKLILTLGLSEDLSGKLYCYSSILIYLEAVAIFLSFLYTKPITGRLGEKINTIAKHSFSVYIIHFAMGSVLFTKMLHVDSFINHVGTGVPAVIVAVIAVYVFCTAVDIVKCRCFDLVGKYLGVGIIGRIYDKLTSSWDKCVN